MRDTQRSQIMSTPNQQIAEQAKQDQHDRMFLLGSPYPKVVFMTASLQGSKVMRQGRGLP